MVLFVFFKNVLNADQYKGIKKNCHSDFKTYFYYAILTQLNIHDNYDPYTIRNVK